MQKSRGARFIRSIRHGPIGKVSRGKLQETGGGPTQRHIFVLHHASLMTGSSTPTMFFCGREMVRYSTRLIVLDFLRTTALI